MRSCVQRKPTASGECIHEDEKGDSKRHLCYCTTDGCNATPDTVSKGKDPRNQDSVEENTDTEDTDMEDKGNIGANIISSLINTIFMTACAVYLL